MPDQLQTAASLTRPEFWDAWAAHHAPMENHYLNVPVIRRIMGEVREPALVVGGGHGLIVAEIQKAGFRCDGMDSSEEMIRHAKLRRGIALIHADARAMPFPDQAYETVIFATGVIDFTADETAIQTMLREARRVVRKSGKVFVAFYRVSPGSESFMRKTGLLRENTIALRESFELYWLNPFQMVTWAARKGGLGFLDASLVVLRVSLLTSLSEKRMTFKMRKLLRTIGDREALVEAVPERQPYRNEAEIRNLFKRLTIQIKQLDAFGSCFMVRI